MTYFIIATQKIDLSHFKEHRPTDKGDNSFLIIHSVTGDNSVH